MDSRERLARGNLWHRILSALVQGLAWFAPHKSLRVFFHRLRGVKIGRNVEIGYFCIIDNVHPHMVEIEDNVTIAAMSIILAHDNSMYYARDEDVKVGKVVIKKNAFIGVHSVILPGVTIGEGAIVGAMSLVNKDVPPHTVVAGIPARIIRAPRVTYIEGKKSLSNPSYILKPTSE